jgi:hypothetical protein
MIGVARLDVNNVFKLRWLQGPAAVWGECPNGWSVDGVDSMKFQGWRLQGWRRISNSAAARRSRRRQATDSPEAGHGRVEGRCRARAIAKREQSLTKQAFQASPLGSCGSRMRAMRLRGDMLTLPASSSHGQTAPRRWTPG